jgi:hypothetical protein
MSFYEMMNRADEVFDVYWVTEVFLMAVIVGVFVYLVTAPIRKAQARQPKGRPSAPFGLGKRRTCLLRGMRTRQLGLRVRRGKVAAQDPDNTTP